METLNAIVNVFFIVLMPTILIATAYQYGQAQKSKGKLEGFQEAEELFEKLKKKTEELLKSKDETIEKAVKIIKSLEKDKSKMPEAFRMAMREAKRTGGAIKIEVVPPEQADEEIREFKNDKKKDNPDKK